ncbi:MAG: hypothetical protein K6360_03770 [Deltaproteobacteria bacterium]
MHEKASNFSPSALPVLIGSLPHRDHVEATDLVFSYTPEIPLWVQLPCYPEERLLSQFATGLPGLRRQGDALFFETSGTAFEGELLAFYEQYLSVSEGGAPLEGSIFAFTPETGKGFAVFLEKALALDPPPVALKGQITGPFTMLTGLKDASGRILHFHPELRDAVIKALAMKARYQVEAMRSVADTAIIFLDEPGISGFGTSSFVGIPREEVVEELTEVMDAVHQAGGLAGIHVCANTDWSLVLSTPIDILSFDAYGFFDRIVLFRNELLRFLEKGKVIAWGIVPTMNASDILAVDARGLVDRWRGYVRELGADPELATRQALITPSCGTGLLSLELCTRVLLLTREVSDLIRKDVL